MTRTANRAGSHMQIPPELEDWLPDLDPPAFGLQRVHAAIASRHRRRRLRLRLAALAALVLACGLTLFILRGPESQRAEELSLSAVSLDIVPPPAGEAQDSGSHYLYKQYSDDQVVIYLAVAKQRPTTPGWEKSADLR